jgi:hypothetical protein
MSEEPTIEYTVKEMIERLDHKVDQFLGILSSKADRSEVALVAERLTVVESKVDTLTDRLKKDEKRAKERREWKRWIIPTACTLVGAAATILSIIVH